MYSWESRGKEGWGGGAAFFLFKRGEVVRNLLCDFMGELVGRRERTSLKAPAPTSDTVYLDFIIRIVIFIYICDA